MSRKTPSSSRSQDKGKRRAATPAKSKSGQGGALKPGPQTDITSESAKVLGPYFPLLLILGLAAIAGTVIIFQATKDGIGITTDSIVYIKVARNLLGGHGFRLSAGGAPLTQYPPVYPAALALAGMLATDLLTGVKWLHLFLYVANVLLVGLLIYRGTAGSLIATIAGLLFMLTSGLVFHSHVVCLSEVLFVFFILTGLLLIDEYLCRGQVLILVAASIVVGLAGMTRYVGFILLGVVTLCIVLLNKSNLLKRFTHAGIVMAIFITPAILWILRNKMISGGMVNRNIVYHPIKFRQIEGAVSTISSWLFIPASLPFALKASLVIIMIVSFLIILIKMIKQFSIHSDLNRIPIICTLFLTLYTLGLVIAIFFVEANLPFSHRILFPFYVVVGIAVIILVHNAFHLVTKSKGFAVFALVLMGAFLIAQTNTMARELRIFSDNGEGFTGKQWKSSKTMEFIKKLPDNTTLYSNGPEAIEFLTGRQTRMIPSKRITTSNEQNVKYSEELRGMMRDLDHSRGYLVYFDLIAWRGYIPSVEELKPYGEIVSIHRAWDGTVYQTAKLEQ
jgi:4-amino-4-deoxy-L-arabinose transferase-like glycosyltransferase